MELVRDPLVLARRFNAFIFSPDVPEGAVERLQSIPGSDADKITQGAEILYAHYDLLTNAGKTVVGLLYDYANSQGWPAFCADGRCADIVALVRGDLGEIKPIDPTKAPEPNKALREDGKDWRPAPPADDA